MPGPCAQSCTGSGPSVPALLLPLLLLLLPSQNVVCLHHSHADVRLSKFAPSDHPWGPVVLRHWNLHAGIRQGERAERLAGGHILERLRGGSATKDAAVKKPQINLASSLEASRAILIWLLKSSIAIMTSLITTSAVMVAFEFTAHKIKPDLQESGMPDMLAALVLAGSLVGSGLGGLVLTKLSPSHPTFLALLVSGLFTAAQNLNLQTVEHPPWYHVAGILSFIPPYLLASLQPWERKSISMTLGALGKGSPRKAKSPVKTTRFKLDPAYDQAEENELQDEEVQSTEDRTDASEPDKTSKTPKKSKTPKTPSSGKKESKTPKKTPRRKDKDS
ncbi:hypothetical protein GUITHDRAFT_164633 [Guillardia theta CCMP2712]|uniref:Uncharacterized protein n=2 Tax=Guillardia theta TaxID=55529 RepID=L1IWS4_GUITC|nr:hypothetical protein GUITHDRAFT_164633 [Guillardia theta CCMP2712]EKX40567.1 hypothetical protein GUITHDRAFT_164633 [Guillardia theta CCMP2712]|eukprot:XP_005827547.1 hypothetical protein GUITHDRAFT_164633 [Guillardia theta CCMP2712]